MAKGKVKWFNNAKGYGFIRPDMGGDDLFVHYTYIEMEGYKTLRAGQPVEYEILEAPKGHHAIQVFAHEEAGFDPSYEGYEQQEAFQPQNTAGTSDTGNAHEYQPPGSNYTAGSHTQPHSMVETI